MRFREYANAEAFLAEARAFAASTLQTRAAEIDRSGKIAADLNTLMARNRFFALESLRESAPPLTPAERLPLLMALIDELATASASAAKLVLDSNLGQVQLLDTFGGDALRARYLPRIRRGESRASFLLTEPESGSDLAKIRCTARRVRKGYRLSGSKDWVTGALDRDLYLVVARSAEADDCMGLLFIDRLEERFHPKSLRIAERKSQLGMRGLGEHRVDFDDVFVPDDWVLIAPSRPAIKEIMRAYSLKRCGQAAIASGVARAATACAYAYARQRYPGARGGLAFQDAAFRFAEMHCRCTASARMVDWAIAEIVRGDDSGVPASMAKLFATETAVDVTNEAMQLCGANATTDSLPLERFLRDARMLTIVGGASAIQKKNITRRLDVILGARPAREPNVVPSPSFPLGNVPEILEVRKKSTPSRARRVGIPPARVTPK